MVCRIQQSRQRPRLPRLSGSPCQLCPCSILSGEGGTTPIPSSFVTIMVSPNPRAKSSSLFTSACTIFYIINRIHFDRIPVSCFRESKDLTPLPLGNQSARIVYSEPRLPEQHQDLYTPRPLSTRD